MTILQVRQRQALQLAAEGLTQAQIGAAMGGMSANTVKHHLDNARWKLNAASIAHAVAIGIRQGHIT